MEASRTEPERVDLHELAKGWKAAIARASDPATRWVHSLQWKKGLLCLREIIDLEGRRTLTPLCERAFLPVTYC